MFEKLKEFLTGESRSQQNKLGTRSFMVAFNVEEPQSKEDFPKMRAQFAEMKKDVEMIISQDPRLKDGMQHINFLEFATSLTFWSSSSVGELFKEKFKFFFFL